jgi:hypothetical protein
MHGLYNELAGLAARCFPAELERPRKVSTLGAKAFPTVKRLPRDELAFDENKSSKGPSGCVG